MINEEKNQHTQPVRKHKIFNNWNIVTDGWYIVCRSSELKKSTIFGAQVCGQQIIVYRDSKGNLNGMDGYCPHMGVDLAIGSVVNDKVRCFFHHWSFNQDGSLANVPCGETPKKKTCIPTYPVREKYGFIWIHPNKENFDEIVDIPELAGTELVYKEGKSFERPCHYHITMINGIDPQHLKTVHNIDIDMSIDIKEQGRNHIQIDLGGEIPGNTTSEKLTQFILGKSYAYSMKYADGCIGALTIMKDCKLFNKFPLPPLHMIFAYSLIEKGRINVQPIYVNKKRSGLFGKLINSFQLWLTKMAFYSLQGEDGAVYDNIRFNTDNFLPMDRPVVEYIGYINRLKASKWSKDFTPSTD